MKKNLLGNGKATNGASDMLDGRFPELRLVDISLIFPACKHI